VNRHCERSEAIQNSLQEKTGLLRRFAPRNDGDTSTLSQKNRGHAMLSPKARHSAIREIEMLTDADIQHHAEAIK
jgi:hypothetical protein